MEEVADERLKRPVFALSCKLIKMASLALYFKKRTYR
jgi:hypothetical protein